ncbi:hypothetical protein HDU76_010731, partial [Blyttiomyces sp. JEL0837]
MPPQISVDFNNNIKNNHGAENFRQILTPLKTATTCEDYVQIYIDDINFCVPNTIPQSVPTTTNNTSTKFTKSSPEPYLPFNYSPSQSQIDCLCSTNPGSVVNSTSNGDVGGNGDLEMDLGNVERYCMGGLHGGVVMQGRNFLEMF